MSAIRLSSVYLHNATSVLITANKERGLIRMTVIGEDGYSSDITVFSDTNVMPILVVKEVASETLQAA